MADITLRHELECSEETYWRCVFDDEYNRRLYLDLLKFPGYTLLESKDGGALRTKKVKIDPPVAGLPGPVKKVVGDRMSYVEEGTLDVAKNRYTFHVTPSTLPDKSKTTGELATESLGEKRCARLVKVHVEVKVFMVGSLIEDKIVQDLRHSYDVSAKFTNEFVNEKGW